MASISLIHSNTSYPKVGNSPGNSGFHPTETTPYIKRLIHSLQTLIPATNISPRPRRTPLLISLIRRRILNTQTSTRLSSRTKHLGTQTQLPRHPRIARPNLSMNQCSIHQLSPISSPKFIRQRIGSPHSPPVQRPLRPIITIRHTIRQRRLRNRLRLDNLHLRRTLLRCTIASQTIGRLRHSTLTSHTITPKALICQTLQHYTHNELPEHFRIHVFRL